MILRAEPLLKTDDRLGECPLWDGAALWWVDIHAPAVKRYSGGKVETFPMPEPVGSIALRAQGDAANRLRHREGLDLAAAVALDGGRVDVDPPQRGAVPERAF